MSRCVLQKRPDKFGNKYNVYLQYYGYTLATTYRWAI